MKKYTYLYILMAFALFMECCGNKNGMLARLDSIDSLMECSPQKAYDSLQDMRRQWKASMGEDMEMKWQLLDTKARNKLFMPLPSDSVFCDVVDFFDRKGTSNEKMMSHYLLGSIYRDMNDAPKAMECFDEAVELVDTTAGNADFNTLSRVYAQMGYIYTQQYLSDKALRSYSLSGYYAKKAGNRKQSIMAEENKVLLLYTKGDTTSALTLLRQCHDSYMKNGYTDCAAGVYPILIYTLLDRGQYREARHYMSVYETESNLVDRFGNVASGFEHYYKAKARYSLGVNKLDSAEWYFRKLGKYHFDYESSKGLLDVFASKGNMDSVRRYSAICEREMDKILQGIQADATLQAMALYNYNRLKKDAEDNRHKKEMMVYVVGSILVLVLMTILFLYSRYRTVRTFDEKKLLMLNERYLQICKELDIAKVDLENIKAGVKPKIDSYVSRIKQLEQEKRKIIDGNNFADMSVAKRNFKLTDAYKTAKTKATMHNKPLSEKDWDNICAKMSFHFPMLYERITSCNILSLQELKICILVWLDFSNSEILYLLSTSPQVLSNGKRSINKKLFATSSARNLEANLKKLCSGDV